MGPRAGLELTHEINQYLYVISGFRLEVHDNCALPAYLAARSGNSLPTFRDNGPENNNFNTNKPLLTERMRYVPTDLTRSLRMFQSDAPQLFPQPHLGNSPTGGGVVVLLRGIPMFPGPAS